LGFGVWGLEFRVGFRVLGDLVWVGFRRTGPASKFDNTHTHTHTHIYIYIYGLGRV
jgi:hypothetical protein